MGSVTDAIRLFKDTPISKAAVLRLMSSEDVHVLGVVRHLIADPEVAAAIVPSLTFEETHPFILEYTERCIRDDPDSDWASGACIAGHEFAHYVRHYWKHHESTLRICSALTSWLECIYRRSDSRTREIIQLCLLEHLLGIEWLAAGFEYWRSDLLLAEAYTAAAQDAGGLVE